MEINPEIWTIEKLIRLVDKINPKPQYQRTPVWSETKKVLLIDSILRKYDLPKFYIKETPEDPKYDYEVTDGQQRMRAIWEFYRAEFKIEGKEINNEDYFGCSYKHLQQGYKELFKSFELSVSIIKKASQEELRTLFARLQMGMTLIPVELRHALASNIGNAIFMVAENHKFFSTNCKIENKRFKHQDYLDHVIALMYYKNERDLKANTLNQLYLDLTSSKNYEFSEYLKKTNQILNWMYEINLFSKGIFRNKWGFVDAFWLLFNCFNKIKKINYEKLASCLYKFELKRKKYNTNPELLIENKVSHIYDKDLYDYIEAFNRQGALKKNISIRHRVYINKFNNSNNFILKDGKIQ